MPEIYVLLSKSVPSGIGPCLWAADEAIEDRVLSQGAVRDGAVVEDLQSASRIFADLIVQNEYGESYSAYRVSVYADIDNGAIFEAQPCTPARGGGVYALEPLRFAILVRSDCQSN